MNVRMSESKQRFFLLRLITVAIVSILVIWLRAFVSLSYSATYYVATNGNDGDPGTLEFPFGTIQKCLDIVQPGDTCAIRAGTYNEGLMLKMSGTSSAGITIRTYNGETVTISSGDSKALRTNGRRHYYTIDGLRFVSNHVMYDARDDYNIDFNDGVWDGEDDPNGGNNHITIKNCYIEGAILLYGHYNTVENCEINGKGLWGNGIHDQFAASHHNTYRGNTIYGFKVRGIWTMMRTDTILIEKNIIYDMGDIGIDCDGAAHPVYNCTVRGNTLYKITTDAIEMENAMTSTVESNLIHHSRYGVFFINYGTQYADDEYRDKNLNAICKNNIIYHVINGGIVLWASPGVKVYNNTIYDMTGVYFGGIALCVSGGYYAHNCTIKNNIVAETKPYAYWIDEPAGGLTNFVLTNNLYYYATPQDTHYISRTDTSYTLAEFQSKFGKEQNSILSTPLFVDTATHDFRLEAASPAIDAGTNLSPYVTDDYAGVLRPQGSGYDIGAYEFIHSRPTPPRNVRIVY